MKKHFINCLENNNCPLCEAGLTPTIMHIIFTEDGKQIMVKDKIYKKIAQKPKKPKKRKLSRQDYLNQIIPFGIKVGWRKGKKPTVKDQVRFQCYCGEEFMNTIEGVAKRKLKCCPKCLKILHGMKLESPDSSYSVGGTKYLKLLGSVVSEMKLKIPDAIKYLEKNNPL